MADAKKCDLCGRFYSLNFSIKDVTANNILYLQKDTLYKTTDKIKVEMCSNCAKIIDDTINRLKQQ